MCPFTFKLPALFNTVVSCICVWMNKKTKEDGCLQGNKLYNLKLCSWKKQELLFFPLILNYLNSKSRSVWSRMSIIKMSIIKRQWKTAWKTSMKYSKRLLDKSLFKAPNPNILPNISEQWFNVFYDIWTQTCYRSRQRILNRNRCCESGYKGHLL